MHVAQRFVDFIDVTLVSSLVGAEVTELTGIHL